MGLSPAQAISKRTVTRGVFVLKPFMCPAVTLGVFTDKLPSSSGLARGQFDQDLKDGWTTQKAPGVESTVGNPPPTGAVQGRGEAPRG